jgi:predicted ATPase
MRCFNMAGLDESALRSSLQRLAEADILFVEGDGAQATYRFKHALIQDAAYDSLLKSRCQGLHARAAEILRESPSPEPEAIAHHFTQAGLDDLAIDWWGKAGDQALRRSAFQEAIAHLGKAIEMADRAGATARSAPGGSAAPNQRLTQLHVARANALWAARGVGAPETTEAFARASESAYGDKDAPERSPSDFGLWASSYIRGELPEMRAHAAAFLRDVEASPDSPEASVAHRTAGITCWFVGDYREARDHLERALALFRPGRDDDLAFRFGQDPGVVAMANLAAASWPLGEVDRAISLIDRMKTRVAGLAHISTLASGKLYAAMFELMRGDHLRATPNALELVRLTGEQELPMFRAYGVFLKGWTSAASGTSGSGLEDMRRGVEQLREQNVLFFDGLLKIALAEAEARAGDPDRAVAILDEALATADRLGYRAFEAELHRARGDALLVRDPPDPAPAEDAFLTAIATAKQQATRTFELRGALALARLYESTGRPVEAHGVLAPALEGFAPTVEMPEITEAQALLTALAEADEVKAAQAQRQRRLHLQSAYGHALSWGKGFAAEETKVAFARASELAANAGNFAGRFATGHSQWALAIVGGEQRRVRELASPFLKEAEDARRLVEVGVARRCLAQACYLSGQFLNARAHCERAQEACDPERERETRERFTDETGPIAISILAVTMWQLGEVERARELIDEANGRARDLGHAPSMAHLLNWKSYLEVLRGEAAAALSAAETLEDLSHEHGMPFWRVNAELKAGWARGRVHNAAVGAEDLRRALAAAADQGMNGEAWFYTVLLADLEAEALGANSALERIDEALVLARQVDNRCDLPFPHLRRGELLLKRDPANSAPAEEAFQTALAIAREQSARSWGLRAALALAKLHQSTDRLADAYAVLSPALEGFSPTPELPEIAEARALLAELAESEEVKAAIAQRQRRLDLQTSYGQALLWAKGFAAEETKAAFARVQEIAGSAKEPAARIAIHDAECLRTFMRGQYREAQEIAETMLREAGVDAQGPEAGAFRRMLGLICLYQGELKAAQTIFERELTEFQLGPAGHVNAAAFLALTEWHLGEVVRARQHIQQAAQRAAEIGDAATVGTALFFETVLESRRDDASATRLAADALLELSEKHGMRTYLEEGRVYANWARGRLLEPDFGADKLEQALAAYIAQDNRADAPSLYCLLAELQADARGPESALESIDQGLAIADETGEHFTDSYLHRLRGDLLLNRNRYDPASAEQAFKAAVAVAKVQGARSYELLASLPLAKLYQSAGRLVDAHAVLAPALEGFSPTPEMPEIAEGQALLKQLTFNDGTDSEGQTTKD